MVLPYLEVSHLASSSSFYSSILQPLGLRYLATDREQSSSVGTVTYGFPSQGRAEPLPILQIREASHPFEPVKFSFIVLAAASPTLVAKFYDCALAANPWLRVQAEGEGFDTHPSGPSPRHRLGIEGGVSPGRATVQDLDGNTIRVVCAPPTAQQDVGHVLEWNFDIASRSKHSRTRSQSHPLPSSASSSVSSHTQSHRSFQVHPQRQASNHPTHAGYGSGASAAMPQRASSHAGEDPDLFPEPPVSPRQSTSNNGLSTTSVVGALLGVAAGAALTYSMVSKERDRRPRHDMEPPMLPRRSTFPEKAPSSHHQPRHDDRGPMYPDYPTKALPYRPARVYEPQALPAPLPYPEETPFRQPIYHDDFAPRKLTYPDEFASRNLSYPEDYTPRRLPYDEDEDSDELPPRSHNPRSVQYLTDDPLLREVRSSATRSTTKSTARSNAGKSTTRSTAKSTVKSTTKSVARSTARTRPPDEIEEARSRHSSRHSRVSGRSRSEAPIPRASATMPDMEHRSRAGSRHSVAAKSTYSRTRSQRPQDHERDTYFSARSRRSSVARHPPPPGVETEIMEAPVVPEAPIHDDYDDYEHVPRGPELLIRNRDGSKFSVTRLSNGGEPPIIMSHPGQAPSHISARNVPLPMSGVGASRADWDDDIVSLAPSDSISCVGSKTSRRSRRLR